MLQVPLEVLLGSIVIYYRVDSPSRDADPESDSPKFVLQVFVESHPLSAQQVRFAAVSLVLRV